MALSSVSEWRIAQIFMFLIAMNNVYLTHLKVADYAFVN